jgi:hypothetical protein
MALDAGAGWRLVQCEGHDPCIDTRPYSIIIKFMLPAQCLLSVAGGVVWARTRGHARMIPQPERVAAVLNHGAGTANQPVIETTG